MLARALRGVDKGFYIDVGAQDPVNDSVTKSLYDRGWHGINVEPVTHWFERLVVDRPRDCNLQLAVSDGPGTLHLFEVVDSGLSTTDRGFAERHARDGHHIRESDIACVTLDNICEVHGVDEVHFLKIDCEGAEEAALRGLSLKSVRPWIILLEATEPNSQEPAYHSWEPLLTERGYHFVYEDGLNRFYVADEHDELDRAFTFPPNVFDQFVRAPEADARAELDAVQGELIALRHNVRHLHDENDRRERALVDHRRMLASAAETSRVQRAELHRRQDELQRLQGEIQRLQGEIQRLQDEIQRLQGETARLYSVIQLIHHSLSWRITAPLRWTKRQARRAARVPVRATFRTLRWVARLLRPLLRLIARWPWMRAAMFRLLGTESPLAARVELFLFGPAPMAGMGASLAVLPPMTRRAAQILEELQDADESGSSGDHPSRSKKV
jgi:FkbM family methyltransferase